MASSALNPKAWMPTAATPNLENMTDIRHSALLPRPSGCRACAGHMRLWLIYIWISQDAFSTPSPTQNCRLTFRHGSVTKRRGSHLSWPGAFVAWEGESGDQEERLLVWVGDRPWPRGMARMLWPDLEGRRRCGGVFQPRRALVTFTLSVLIPHSPSSSRWLTCIPFTGLEPRRCIKPSCGLELRRARVVSFPLSCPINLSSQVPDLLLAPLRRGLN